MAENGWIIGLAIIAVLGLVAVATLKTTQIDVKTTPQQELLSVTGTHEFEVAPDQALLVLQVMTRDPDAKQASAQNKQLLTTVMAALKAQGVQDSQIETTGLTLQRWTEWEKDPTTPDGKYVDKGYEQVTTVKVTMTDFGSVGSVLDAAVAAGANAVQDVSFTLKPETEQRYKEEALTLATQAAKRKATLLATASGAKLGKIAALSENSWIQPFISNTKSVMEAAGAPTPISPEKVTLSVSVNMAYELE